MNKAKQASKRKSDQRRRYKDRGMVRKDIWVYPGKWKAIQAAITKVQGEM